MLIAHDSLRLPAGPGHPRMFSTYCCCFGDDSEHVAAEVPLSQVASSQNCLGVCPNNPYRLREGDS